jgi:ribosomal protein L7/L12
MATVRITGWREGLEKISHTKALQQMAGLSLADAKAVTDAVLEGQSRSVRLPSAALASELAAQLRNLGAEATVED